MLLGFPRLIFIMSYNFCIIPQHNELMKETRKFIKAYDSIVLHQEPYRSLFLLTLNYLRENLVRLIQKFGTLSKNDSKVKSVECCGVSDLSYMLQHLRNKQTCPYCRFSTIRMTIWKNTMNNRITEKPCSQLAYVRFVEFDIMLLIASYLL